MSSIIVRNVIGQNDFAIPATESEADAATSAFRTMLDGIAWLHYDDARVLLISNEGDPTPELLFLVSTFFYDGTLVPTTNSVRAALQSAFIGEPNIISVGDINIDGMDPGQVFWHQWPEIDHIDSTNGVVYFKDNVPAGAQIEMAKFSKHARGAHSGYSDRKGKRYRRSVTLPRGVLSVDLSPLILGVRGRNCFRFRYVWPPPHGALAPAKSYIGPLAPYGVVTASLNERIFGATLFIEAGPSLYSH
jgi:hypothetical protein